jgi:hypothetical protein
MSAFENARIAAAAASGAAIAILVVSVLHESGRNPIAMSLRASAPLVVMMVRLCIRR